MVILIALVMAGKIVLRYETTLAQRASTWLVAIPVFIAAMGANVVYHAAIIRFTGQPLVEDQLLKFSELLPLLIFVICIQPAIIEELFMRQLFLGVLSPYMGKHGAVWISAVAFGMLHISSPLSIPYLIVLGGVLGYLRVASGTILLPIVFHFAHNAAVITLEIMS